MTTTTEMKTDRSFTRRQFIKGHLAAALAASAFPTLIPASALGRDGRPAPSNRITLGIIGCGPQGRGVLGNFLNEPDCQVLAACDLKTDQLKLAADAVNTRNQNQDCRTYHDFRELVARRDIDACLVATPDHWHVLTSIAAINAGKDVYMEKPLAPSLTEGQALRTAVKRKKRVFQFGTQQRSGRSFRLACELVRNGYIGKLKHINVWAPGSAPGGSLKAVPPPDDLDFATWLGPAPPREYTENLCTDKGTLKTWWFVSDFTLGFIAGWGVHPLDIALWGGADLLGGSVEVQGRGTFRNAEGICDTAVIWEVDFTFASGVTLKFVGLPNGGNQGASTGDPSLHRDEWEQRYLRIASHGTAFEGADGWVHVNRNRVNAEPVGSVNADAESFKIKLIRSSYHARNFLDCVKSRAETISPVDAAVAVDLLCHAADIAIRLGRKVTLDLKRETFRNDPEANQRLKGRGLRAPWKL